MNTGETEKRIFTVTEFTNLLKGILEDNLTDVWIDGEVSNLRDPASGHLYFTLKDENSQIRAVLFKYQKRRAKFELKDGMRIIAHGRITVYSPRGEYQIVADHLEPKGLGALQKAYEQLKEKLAKEGLFDETHKKPIPSLPKKIGIVTSATGAALQDMLNIIDRRFTNIHILIYPVKVQGDGAAEEITMAIEELNTLPDIDVIITGRGGGSIEDLWAFNEEIVARAIFKSRIPVISAVGHETDFTIADFAADMRAPTPSAAAELVIKNKKELIDKILSLQKRLVDIYKNKIVLLKNHVENLAQKRNYLAPIKRINEYQQRMDDILFTMDKSITSLFNSKREKINNLVKNIYYVGPVNRLAGLKESFFTLEREMRKVVKYRLTVINSNIQGLMKRLDSVSPLSVLERGFSICTKFPSLEVIKEASDVHKGDKIDVRLYQGELICTIEDVI